MRIEDLELAIALKKSADNLEKLIDAKTVTLVASTGESVILTGKPHARFIELLKSIWALEMQQLLSLIQDKRGLSKLPGGPVEAEGLPAPEEAVMEVNEKL